MDNGQDTQLNPRNPRKQREKSLVARSIRYDKKNSPGYLLKASLHQKGMAHSSEVKPALTRVKVYNLN